MLTTKAGREWEPRTVWNDPTWCRTCGRVIRVREKAAFYPLIARANLSKRTIENPWECRKCFKDREGEGEQPKAQ